MMSNVQKNILPIIASVIEFDYITTVSYIFDDISSMLQVKAERPLFGKAFAGS